MPRPVEPANAILPVLLVDHRRDAVKVIGTAFFFSWQLVILSIAHVLGVEPGPDEYLAVPKRDAPDPAPGVVKYHRLMAPVTNVRRHPRHDLAVADVPGLTYFDHFPLCSSEPHALSTVLTYDLVSRVMFEAVPGSEPIQIITPYVWKGYTHGTRLSGGWYVGAS